MWHFRDYEFNIQGYDIKNQVICLNSNIDETIQIEFTKHMSDFMVMLFCVIF